MKAALDIAAGKLTLGMLRRIARGEARVALDPATRPAIDASRAAVQQAVDHGAPAYGINTGLASSQRRTSRTISWSGCRPISFTRTRSEQAHCSTMRPCVSF